MAWAVQQPAQFKPHSSQLGRPQGGGAALLGLRSISSHLMGVWVLECCNGALNFPWVAYRCTLFIARSGCGAADREWRQYCYNLIMVVLGSYVESTLAVLAQKGVIALPCQRHAVSFPLYVVR